ncbi:hypothetical protein CPB86DRAFT_88058 [Serendipita vermifera]|nr:hypothetical protein CPB86DRAFT_88058 [Serendipita vermifera]
MTAIFPPLVLTTISSAASIWPFRHILSTQYINLNDFSLLVRSSMTEHIANKGTLSRNSKATAAIHRPPKVQLIHDQPLQHGYPNLTCYSTRTQAARPLNFPQCHHPRVQPQSKERQASRDMILQSNEMANRRVKGGGKPCFSGEE